MTDLVDLAIQYGGFTSLDRVYLEQVLERVSPEQQLTFITPPPSVINAYFAEIYQKQNPQAATTYFLELSRSLKLCQAEPSFAEIKPFVRLNLSGKSFGFAYVNEDGLAQVFSEEREEWTANLFFEIAQIFPHLVVFQKKDCIFLREMDWTREDWQEVVAEEFLLSQVSESADWVRISGLNQEEVLEVAAAYSGQSYYAWSGRQALVYIRK